MLIGGMRVSRSTLLCAAFPALCIPTVAERTSDAAVSRARSVAASAAASGSGALRETLADVSDAYIETNSTIRTIAIAITITSFAILGLALVALFIYFSPEIKGAARITGVT